MEQLQLAVTSINIKITKEIEEDIEKAFQRPVSYTHLTLPTKA